jgi:hypothetical protein
MKAIAAKGSGKIALILPDTTSSARYVDFDAPMMKEALTKAGLSSSDYVIQNGDGSDNTFYTDAVGDIANGVKVLIIDPEDSTTGEIVEAYAASHGVKVIDYDRLTLGGQRDRWNPVGNRPHCVLDGVEGEVATRLCHVRFAHGQQRHTLWSGLQRGAQGRGILSWRRCEGKRQYH